MKFDCPAEVRHAEAAASVQLINDNEAFQKYYKTERMALKDFRFPPIFLRYAKKAFISFISPEVVEIPKSIC